MTDTYDSIVCLGDSITYGQFLTQVAWPKLVVGHMLLNAGISNETTRNGLERFPRDVQQVGPKAVILQFGLNDCNRWESDRGLPRVSLAAYVANLEEMVRRCRAFSIRPFLCTLTPTRKSARHSGDAEVYDAALREVATRMDVELIDVRTAFEAWRDPADADWTDLVLPDGVHLNEVGHRVFATTVQRALDGHWPR